MVNKKISMSHRMSFMNEKKSDSIILSEIHDKPSTLIGITDNISRNSDSFTEIPPPPKPSTILSVSQEKNLDFQDMLIKGFGMRNLKSLHDALLHSTNEKKMLMKCKESLLIQGFDMRNAKSLQEALDKEEENKRKSPFKTGFTFKTTQSIQEMLAVEQKHEEKLLHSVELQETEIKKEPINLSKGFTMRNLTSFEQAFLLEQEKRRRLLMNLQKIKDGEEETFRASEASTSVKSASLLSKKLDYVRKDVSRASGFDEYMEKMSVHDDEEEGETEIVKEKKIYVSAVLKKAQVYLESHSIFKFFQFLLIHLLSKRPENPLEFLLDILDKCLLYRAGVGKPPLLYEKEHIEKMFSLMDPMRTGFISMQQYRTAMKTFMITKYNTRPPCTPEGFITEETFVSEIMDSIITDFNRVIKRHWHYGGGSPHSIQTPPPTVISTTDWGEH